MRRGSGLSVAILLAVGTLAYGLFQARTLIAGPELTVTSPRPGETVEGPVYSVRGSAHNISRVRINGRAITTDLSGKFEETLVTPDGYGVLLVEAENRLGKYTSTRVEFVGVPRPEAPETATSTATSTDEELGVKSEEI